LISGHESKIPPGEQSRAVKERAKRGFQPFMEEGALASNSEQNVPSARPICFVAAKDEFDPLGSSICSEKKRETKKHL
jgi:hypothetical protein